jgi:hypothetical protein
MMTTPVFEKDLTGLLVVDPYNDFISEGGILWPLIKEIAEAVDLPSFWPPVPQASESSSHRITETGGPRMKSRAGSTSHPFRNSATNDVSSELEPGAESFAKNSRRCPAKWLRKNTGAPAVSRTQIWIFSLRSTVSIS